jgi:hypothetical protein
MLVSEAKPMMRHPLRTLLFELFVEPVRQFFQRAFELGHRLALSEAATADDDLGRKRTSGR